MFNCKHFYYFLILMLLTSFSALVYPDTQKCELKKDTVTLKGESHDFFPPVIYKCNDLGEKTDAGQNFCMQTLFCSRSSQGSCHQSNLQGGVLIINEIGQLKNTLPMELNPSVKLGPRSRYVKPVFDYKIACNTQRTPNLLAQVSNPGMKDRFSCLCNPDKENVTCLGQPQTVDFYIAEELSPRSISEGYEGKERLSERMAEDSNIATFVSNGKRHYYYRSMTSEQKKKFIEELNVRSIFLFTTKITEENPNYRHIISTSTRLFNFLKGNKKVPRTYTRTVTNSQLYFPVIEAKTSDPIHEKYYKYQAKQTFKTTSLQLTRMLKALNCQFTTISESSRSQLESSQNQTEN